MGLVLAGWIPIGILEWKQPVPLLPWLLGALGQLELGLPQLLGLRLFETQRLSVGFLLGVAVD